MAHRWPIERYADVLAHVVHFAGSRTEVLEALGVAEAEWLAAETEHTSSLELAQKRQQSAYALRFVSTFARVRGRLQRSGATIASVRREAQAVPAKPPPTGEPMAIPSYLRDDPNKLDQGGPKALSTPAASATVPQPPAGVRVAPEVQALPDLTIMQSSSLAADSETLPFVPAPKDLVRASAPLPEHVPTGTTAPSSESPRSLPFIAKQAAKEETKLRPDQIDLSLFPLELYAEISGGLARGDDRAKLLASRGLTDSLFDVLAQAWARKLATDPNLMARFKELARQTASAARRSL